jgi:hypothetical protein
MLYCSLSCRHRCPTRKTILYATCARARSKHFSKAGLILYILCRIICWRHAQYVVFHFVLITSVALIFVIIVSSYHQHILFYPRYHRHITFHALQLSRLSYSSLKNLATCVAQHRLPADFPPLDLIQHNEVSVVVAESAASPISPPISEGLTKPNDGTCSKRPRSQPEAAGNVNNSHTICAFVPTAIVSGGCCRASLVFLLFACCVCFCLSRGNCFEVLSCAEKHFSVLCLWRRIQVVSLGVQANV